LKLWICCSYTLDQAHPRYHEFAKRVEATRNKQIINFFRYGFGIHHAGMIRPHRTLVEKLFEVGLIRVLSCTSTLAWGVNLPAYAVIIKGTEIYADGNYIDLSVLDVQQIFGRAGRPQYDTSGEATVLNFFPLWFFGDFRLIDGNSSRNGL